MQFFSFFMSSNFIFFTNECPGVYVDIDQGIHSEKIKVARNEKRKKLHRFSYHKNIANFEMFWQDKNFSKNLLYGDDANFWKCLLTEKNTLKTLFLILKTTEQISSVLFFCKIWRLQLHSIASDAKNLFRTRISNLYLITKVIYDFANLTIFYFFLVAF